MPRSRKATTRARGRGKGRGRGEEAHIAPVLATSFVPFADTAIRDEDDAYSLKSGAPRIQREQFSWESNQALRHTKVMFVSAGNSEKPKVTDPEIELGRMTLSEISKRLRNDDHGPKVDLLLGQDGVRLDQDERFHRIFDDTNGRFIVDTQGSDPVVTGIPTPQIRSVSPTPSASSEEVIVFTGRGKAGRGLNKLGNHANKSAGPYTSKIRMSEDKIHDNKTPFAVIADRADQTSTAQQRVNSGSSVQHGQSARRTSTGTRQQPVTPMLEAEATRGSSYLCAQSHRSWKVKQTRKNASIDDYISNVEAQEPDPGLFFNQRDLGSPDIDPWQETRSSSFGLSKKPSSYKWDCLKLSNSGFASTSDEMLGSIQAILSKRSRENAEQYLVVWEGHTVDDARWVPSSSLTDVKSSKLIAEYEAVGKSTDQILNEKEDDANSDVDNISVSSGDSEASGDNIDLLQRKIDRMTDEKIARLLAKQEELGLGSSGLIPFDGSPERDLHEGDARNRPLFKSNRRAYRKMRDDSLTGGDFPSVSALADAYDRFDVMDFERPSIKKKPKGWKGRLGIDLSDSELDTSFSVTLEKDRSKKKAKKEERQALRVQGRLGKKAKPDLTAKYEEGMGIHAVKDEIKNFLIGDDTTLALPPMDKADRKVVHEIANAFNLKSKSAGNGNKRFPVLYRTKHTSSFSAARFAAAESWLTRRYLPRTGLRGKNSISVSKQSGRGGISAGAVSYRDGDVVGGSAPELGIENKGRAMLEKMGWSTGTALGAPNNKGILQPVSHIVKTSKAGLG